MARTLVIGAGGQVGAGLIPLLCKRGYDVDAADKEPLEKCRARPAFLKHLGEDSAVLANWRHLDATCWEAVEELIRDVNPDTVFHLAAILSGAGEKDPSRCWQVNIESLRNVLVALDELHQSSGNRRKLIWPSSVGAFGPPPGSHGAYDATNESPLLPRTMYGVTKVAGELLGAYYATKRNVDFRSLRFPGLLNETLPQGGSSDYANQMYYNAATAALPLETFVRADSCMPFMHMDDAIKALVDLAEADEAQLSRRTYNIAAFNSPTASEIEASIVRYVPDFQVTYKPDGLRETNVDSWPNGFDDEPARTDWGWQPVIDSLDELTRKLLHDFGREDLQLT